MIRTAFLAMLLAAALVATVTLPGRGALAGDDDQARLAMAPDPGDISPRDQGESDGEKKELLEERTYRHGGLLITVRLMERERDAVDFELDVENPEGVGKTLRARLCLFDTRVRNRDCGSGEEPLFVDVKAKSTVTLKVRVLPLSIWEAWTLVVVKVHDK